MIDSLKETDNDWIDFKKFEPTLSDYYDVSACDDPDNVIKWQTAAYRMRMSNSGGKVRINVHDD